jgi:dynactin 1
LPQIYVETDADATRCYLFFQRMAAKTDLINMITAQAHNLPESLNGSVSETLVGVCEVAYDATLIGMWPLIIRLDEGCHRGALNALQTFRRHPSLLRC